METTWPLDTVLAISRLYVKGDIDDQVKDYAPEALGVWRYELAHQLRYEAQTYGVDLCVADVVFDEQPSERPFCSTITARWAPSTNEVELSCAGPNDGRVMTLPDVWQELRLPVASRVSLAAMPDDGYVVPSLHYQALRLSGWREVARRWVMREVA